MRVIIASMLLVFMIFTSCKKEMLNPGDLTLNTSQSKSGSGLSENSTILGKDYFTSFGGKWELIWVKEGIPGLENEYSLPYEELREGYMDQIPCGNDTYIDTTFTYTDIYKSHRFTFTTYENLTERSVSRDLDPVQELSNCNKIHFLHTEFQARNEGNWNYEPQTNSLTWLIKTGNDDLYTFFSKYDGIFEKINESEFWYTGILSMYAEENGIPGGITSIPFKYRIKRFSEKNL